MRYSLNFKLVLILTIATLASVVGIYSLHRYQAQRTAGILLIQAQKKGLEGDARAELDLLKRYLSYRPDDLDALQSFGEILAKSSAKDDRVKALDTLDRVLRRDAGRTKVRRLAAGVAWDLGQIDAARAHYEWIEKENPNGDADAELALSRCEENAKRFAEAVAWLQKAIKNDGSKIEAHVRLARLLRGQMRQPEQADLVIDAREIRSGLIARNPRSARAFLERSFYRREFLIDGASEDIKQALVLAPDDADVLLSAAAIETTRDGAARRLERGIEVHPKDLRFYESFAGLETRAGRRDRAIEVLKKGVEALPQEGTLLWLLVEIEIDEGRIAEAEAGIKLLRKMPIPVAPLDFLDARILVSKRKWTDAARNLAKTAPTLESTLGSKALAKRAFLLMASCHSELGNPDMRYSAARRAVALEVPDPSYAIIARTELASSLATLGKLDQSAEEYRIALRLPGAPTELRIDLARVLVAKNFRLAPQQRRWEEVEQGLIELETLLRDSAELAILRAEIMAAQEHLDDAEVRLKQAEKTLPDSPRPQVALSVLAERRGRSAEALTILEEARKRLGDKPELLAALTRYWSSRVGESSSRELIKLVDVAWSLSDESIRRPLLEDLANGLDLAGETARASAIRERLVAEQPDHLGLRLAQLDAALKGGDLDKSGLVLGEIRRIEGAEGSLWRYGRALMLIQASKKSRDPAILIEARTLLGEVRERRPAWSRAILAAAELDDIRGDTGSALREYLAALEYGSRDAGAIKRAVQLLYRRGRFSQADSLIRRAQQEGALSPELGRLAADVALQSRDDNRAIDLARKAVAGQPDLASNQTWLGQLLFSASRKTEERGETTDLKARRLEAEKALIKGVELAPGDPEAQVSLVLALAAWDRKDEARQAIHRAEATLTGPAGELALARCLEAVGQSSEADSKYQAILKARPDDVNALQAASIASLRAGKLRDAEPWLRRLIALKSQTPREAAWARRVLALALTLEGKNGPTRAMELLGLDEDSTSGSAEIDARTDLSAEEFRARAQVLARQPSRASRRKALALIETLTARDEARPSDLFLKAQLLSAEGDWKRASATAQQLLIEDPYNLTILVFLARGQINAGNPDQAETWIGELARIQPNSPLIAELTARALFAKGKAEEAVTVLDNLASKDPNFGLPVVNLLEEAKQFGAAEAMLRKLDAKKDPVPSKVDIALALVKFLGGRERHAEAIEICEKLWSDPKIPPSNVSSVALIALYTGKPDRSILQRVENGIRTSLGRKPDDIVLKFDLANLQILKGQYAEAEAMFRALHQADPEIGAPLNNLAWLLALRGQGQSEALDLIDRAIAIDGPSASLLDTRGIVLTFRGQPDRAVEDLEESIAEAPSSITYLHLAQALQKIGRTAEATEALNKARTYGLRPGDIHPLEQPGYLEIVKGLTNH